MTPEQKAALQRAALRRATGGAPSGGVSANSEAIGEFKGKLSALGRGAVQGLSLRTGDEAAGLDAAVLGITRNDDGSRNFFDYSGGFGERFRGATDRARNLNEQAQTAEPIMFGAGEIAGGTAPAVAAAPAATGASLLSTMFRGGLLGAGEGGVAGAGGEDGQGELGKRTLQGAGIGAGVGAVAPLAVAGASAAKNAVLDPATGIVDKLTGRANKTKANRAILDALKGGKQTPQELAASIRQAGAEGQPDFRLMDALGEAGQRKASGLSRAGGGSGEEITEFLKQRQRDGRDRVLSFTDDAFGLDGRTRQSFEGEVRGNRNKVSDSLYSQARNDAEPVDVRDALGVIDARVGGMEGVDIKGDGIDAKLRGYRDRLASRNPGGTKFGEDASSVELSDFNRVLGVKQDLQDDIEAAKRAGRGNEARELIKLSKSLDGALEQSSDIYRSANDLHREGSRVLDAFETGAGIAKRGRPGDTIPAFNSLTEQQQRAARIGFGDEVSASIERNKAAAPNAAREFGSTKRQAESGALAIDPELLQRRIGRENTMFETFNRATGGSRTADNLQDVNGLAENAAGVAQVAQSAGNLQIGTAAAQLARLLGPAAKGQTDETRKLIARMLLSSDPQKALGPALKQGQKSDKARRLIEGLLRSAQRSGNNPEVQTN